MRTIESSKNEIRNIVRDLHKQGNDLWEIWLELKDVVEDEYRDIMSKQQEEANKPEPAGGYVKAHYDGSEVIAVREDGSGIIAVPYTQEELDDYVTFENLVEYLEDASELPEGYETYEEWAGAMWSCGDQYQVMMEYVDYHEWKWICHLAGIDEDEYPYGDLRASGWNMVQYMPKAA